MKLITLAITALSLNVSAAVHTTPAGIVDVVTSIENVNKKIVGLNSVSVQKFTVSKIDITKAVNHEDIGLCTYDYTVYLTNADSEVKAALKGDDFFSGQQTVREKCRF